MGKSNETESGLVVASGWGMVHRERLLMGTGVLSEVTEMF